MIVAGAAAAFGAALSLVSNLTFERLRTPAGALAANITKVQLQAPEASRASANNPQSPTQLREASRALFQWLDSRPNALPDSAETARLLIQLADSSGQLVSMTTASGLVDLKAWELNVDSANITNTRHASFVKEMQSLRMILADTSIPLENRREKFKASTPDFSPAILDAVAGVLARTKNQTLVGRLGDGVKAHDVVWPYSEEPGDERGPPRLVFRVPFGETFIPNQGSSIRKDMVKLVAEVLSRLEPSLIGDVFSEAERVLQADIEVRRRFLDATDKALRELVPPRVLVEVVVTNEGRVTVAVAPQAAFSVDLPNWPLGSAESAGRVHLPLVFQGTGAARKKAQELAEGVFEYVVLSPGDSKILRWFANYEGDEWQRIVGAYQSKTIACSVAVSTSRGGRVLSPVAPFSERNRL